MNLQAEDFFKRALAVRVHIPTECWGVRDLGFRVLGFKGLRFRV